MQQSIRAGEGGPINFKEVDPGSRRIPTTSRRSSTAPRGYLNNGKAEPAMKDLDRAIALKPDYAPAYLKRAIAHAMLGQQPQAWPTSSAASSSTSRPGR
jgi:Tfp pilus assembly protein PilF